MTPFAVRGATPDAAEHELLDEIIESWKLRRDGLAFATATSVLQPVRTAVESGQGEQAAMLKVAKASPTGDEERIGFAVQRWWNGIGAAAVYRHQPNAVLLERALGRRSLNSMSSRFSEADDDHALRLLCLSVSRLHTPREQPLPDLVALDRWFAELFSNADALGGTYLRGADIAAEVLAEEHTPVVLHGDIHHDNVLDFDRRGWLAVDPKGLYGAAEFDYANMLCNPMAQREADEKRLRRRVHTVSLASGIPVQNLLRWTIAWTALSASRHATAGGEQRAAGVLAVGDTATRILLDR